MREPPSCNLGAVDTVLVCVCPACDLMVTEFLFRVTANLLQLGYAIDRVNCQAKAINFVVHRQLHWCVDVTFLLVAANMDPFVIASVSQAVNQPWVSVEIEDDRFVGCE